MRAFLEPHRNAATLRPLRLRYLACLAALFIPFATRAQVGIVDHDWSFQRGSARYGAMQITYPGPNTYTFFYFGKAEYRVRASATLLGAAAAVPIAMVALLLVRFGPGTRSRTDKSETKE